MNTIFSLVVHTANILGSFNDPFEFQGDYGPEVNPTRQQVFELVVSKEAIARNLNESQIKELLGHEETDAAQLNRFHQTLINDAIQHDRQHGPTLAELIPSGVIEHLKTTQKNLQSQHFSTADLKGILNFIERYSDQKVFYFLRNHPSTLLNLEKILKDNACMYGKPFDLPVLSSTAPLLISNDPEGAKKDLLHKVFTEENLSLAKSEDQLRTNIAKLDPDFLKAFFGENANTQDLQAFCSPSGQVFFYWLYQSLNLHLVSTDDGLIQQINKVKDIFLQTLGDPEVRAASFREKLIQANSGVVFTQESDALVSEALTNDGLFHSVSKQNSEDGTLVFLRSDLWEPDYRVLSDDSYNGFAKGRLNVILARNKQTGTNFLVASAHGNSTRAEDGRLQISLIMQMFEELRLQPENAGLQVIIGIDANTKNEEDVLALREHLDHLGLVGTSVGPTTVKQRMVTVQHSKAGRFAIDEEDYVIVLKQENGGAFSLTTPTVGFRTEKPDPNATIPDKDNPSDHYPVGVVLL